MPNPQVTNRRTPIFLATLVAAVIRNIETGDEDQARTAYREIERVFDRCMAGDPVLGRFDVFVFELGSYLFDDVKKSLGVIDKAKILDLYYCEFLDDLKQVS